MKKILNLSGGGTKLVGILFAALRVLASGFRPDVYTGVSAGAYIALCLAMGKTHQAQRLVERIIADMLSVMFKPSPITRRGGVSPKGILNAVTGKPYLGKQQISLQLLREIITEAEFAAWAADADAPEAWVLSVDFVSGARNFINLKTLPFEAALQQVLASGSMPVFVEGVTVEELDQVLYDGGVRAHIASESILKQYAGQIGEMISIYSRPQDYQVTMPAGWRPKNVLAVLLRMIDIMIIENSKACEYYELKESAERGIDLRQIFLPSIMLDPYDTDPGRLGALKQASIRAADGVLQPA